MKSCIEGADLTVPVPSCPGWNVGQLLRHLGGAQRWAEATVRIRATQPLPDEHFRDLSAYTDEDPAVLGPLTDLLLLIYKRRPARGEGIEILGDVQLLDFWLERVSFG